MKSGKARKERRKQRKLDQKVDEFIMNRIRHDAGLRIKRIGYFLGRGAKRKSGDVITYSVKVPGQGHGESEQNKSKQ